MKLVAIKEFTGTIICNSGLHIGAGDTEMRIGGTDNPVVKHPHTNEPYIPGSSLKGKVRSLLEMRSGLMGKTKGEPLNLRYLKNLQVEERKACEQILRLFGASGADSDDSLLLGPCRVSFADCPLEDGWRDNAAANHLSLTEVKSENTINRIQGVASNPRFTERVPAGARFRFTAMLKCMEGDDDLESLLLQGLKLLQLDALGGSGSRGYGKVIFVFDDEGVQTRFDQTEAL
jgi:CRISPR-associated protein Csm3